MKIDKGIYYTQAYNCWGCIHVGMRVIYIGRKKGYGWRLELFTRYHKFRFSRGKEDTPNLICRNQGK